MNSGENLIFLISQPRAGSTMTQRILGSHSLIHTQSEPWVLLHPLNALKLDNIQTAYDMSLYIKGLNDFINHLPGKEKFYQLAISEAYQQMYDSVLHQENKKFFLDKTPRYYYIINELSDYFPKAKFIFLWRNPAAVLSSIVKTWSKEDWYRLSDLKDDLLYAPKMMLYGIDHLKDKALVLNYEDLLTNPGSVIKTTCKFLAVPFEESIIEYGQFKVPIWQFGDQSTVIRKGRPDISHANTWLTYVNNPQMWRVISDYIHYLGGELISSMGYDLDIIIGLLEQNKPSVSINIHTIPLSDLLNTNRSILIENKRLERDLKTAHEGLKARDENLRARNEIIGQKDKLIGEREKTIQQSKIDFSKIQGSLEEKRSLIENQQIFITEKEKQIEKIKTDLSLADKACIEKDILLKAQSNNINTLKSTLHDKETKVRQLETEVTSLKLSIEEKESEVSRLGSEVGSLNLSLKENESEVSRLGSEVGSLNLSLKEKESEVSRLSSEVGSLNLSLKEKESEVVRLGSEVGSLKHSLKEKEFEVGRLNSEENSLKLTLNEKDSQVQRLGSEVASLKLSLREQESLATKLYSEITTKKQELELNKANTDKLLNQLAALQGKLQANEEYQSRLQEENQLLNRNIAKFKENEAKLIESLSDQKKQIQELKEFIRSIEQSYTFRIGKTIIWPASKLKQAFKSK